MEARTATKRARPSPQPRGGAGFFVGRSAGVSPNALTISVIVQAILARAR